MTVFDTKQRTYRHRSELHVLLRLSGDAAPVEATLFEHPAVADVAVIGIPDEQWGETVMAMIVRSDPELDDQEVIDFARTQLAGYKVPRSVQWIDALPRNPSGKVLRRELRG